MNNIKISLIIPTYNRPHLLKRALQSISSNSFDEILVVNDGSIRKNTNEIEKILLDYPEIKYIKHPTNMGLAESRNTGIKESKYEWITFLDDDDYYSKNPVQDLKLFIKNNPQADIVHYKIRLKNSKKTLDWGCEKFTLADLVNYNRLSGSSLINKKVWKKLNGYHNIPYEDWEFWIRAKQANFNFVFYNDIFYTREIQNDSLENSTEKIISTIDWKIEFLGYDLLKQCLNKEIALGLSTFLRDDSLFRLINSNLEHLCEFRMYIVDQGCHSHKKDLFYRKLQKMGHVIKYIDYDSGISKTRGVLKDICKEPYLVFMEDDFQSFYKTNLYKLKEILNENPDIGVVGGSLEGNSSTGAYSFYLDRIENKICYFPLDYLLDKNLIQWEHTSNNTPFIRANIVSDFTMWRKEVPNIFDENVKTIEHSINGNEPIIIKKKRKNSTLESIDVLPIKTLFPISQLIQQNKQIKLNNTYCWTEFGWEKIRKILAHKVIKKMYRLFTSSGSIDCTEDHSLIIHGKEITPKKLQIGDKIQLCKYPELSNENSIDSEWAWLLGFFLAEGCCKTYKANNQPEPHYNINFTNQNINFLIKTQNILSKFNIDSYLIKSGYKRKDKCNFLKIREGKKYYNIFKEFYNQNLKTIPSSFYKWNKNSRIAFFNGFYDGDGTKHKNNIILNQKSNLVIQGLIFLMSDIYPRYSIKQHKNIYGQWWTLTFYKKIKKLTYDIINKIEAYNINDWVYDIEINNSHHSFCGGIGNINLHNTHVYLLVKNKTNYKVAYCPEAEIRHIHDNSSTVYNEFRSRKKDLEYLKKYWNVLDFYSFTKNKLIQLEKNANTNLPKIEPVKIVDVQQKEEEKINNNTPDTTLEIFKQKMKKETVIFIINYLKESNIDFCLLKNSCLEAVINKEIISEKLCIGVDSKEYKELLSNNLKDYINFVDITICPKMKTKNWVLYDIEVKVPNPLVKYLQTYTKKSWEEIKKI
jgi:glycosyltransferase involved in cell wall biosynthesis